MKTIKAIETEYNSVRYRSKNEARWAVFLDCLGIDFQYEPQGYEMTDGNKTIKYLPDFFIPKSGMFDKDLYIEIKPSEDNELIISDYSLQKVKLFGSLKRICILGSLHDYKTNFDNFSNNYGDYHLYFGNQDGYCDCGYAFCQCEFCGCFGFEFNGRSARINCCDKNNDGNDKRYNSDSSIIMKAIDESCKYRFWK